MSLVSHPNRLLFRGVLAFVDRASDRSPCGARGHRVIVECAAVERALDSLIGMGLDYSPSLDRHDARRKVGVINDAHLIGEELRVEGHIYARDFPEVAERLPHAGSIAAGAGDVGLSYEVTDTMIRNLRSRIWIVADLVFTGAAILLREKAAYRDTWIETFS